MHNTQGEIDYSGSPLRWIDDSLVGWFRCSACFPSGVSMVCLFAVPAGLMVRLFAVPLAGWFNDPLVYRPMVGNFYDLLVCCSDGSLTRLFAGPVVCFFVDPMIVWHDGPLVGWFDYPLFCWLMVDNSDGLLVCSGGLLTHLFVGPLVRCFDYPLVMLVQ